MSNQLPRHQSAPDPADAGSDSELAPGGARTVDGAVLYEVAATAIEAATEITDQLSELHAGAEARLQMVLHMAEEKGLDVSQLNQLVRRLQGRKPLEQKTVLGTLAAEAGVSASELLVLARRYRTETILAAEQGALVHYHQTRLDSFETIASHHALMSHDRQRELGIARINHGSRPDVVQFTRDEYGSDGRLRRSGLVESSTLGIVGGVTLAFGESIMEEEGYDPIGEYPSISQIALDGLQAVIIDSEDGNLAAQGILERNGINVPVLTQQVWRTQHYPQARSARGAQIMIIE